MKKNWQCLWPFIFSAPLLLTAGALSPALVRAEGEIGDSGGPDVPPESCLYFEHIDYGGASNSIPLGVRRKYVGDAWNDRISSIACWHRCRLEVSEHRDFAGATRSFAAGFAHQYVGDEWNDRISSMTVICDQPSKKSPDCTFGPDTCEQSFVWREAAPNDHVCVNPKDRDQAQQDNKAAASRIQSGGGPFGPDTCRQGFVWREAFPGDHVCVEPPVRIQAAQDNSRAMLRRACRQ